MNKTYFLFWQTFSLPIAYIVSNTYLNINNYITQLDNLFHTKFPVNFNESGVLALIIFLITFTLPNLYVFTSLHSVKQDLINGRIQRDIHITPYDQYIEINGKKYTIKHTPDSQLISFFLTSMIPLLINYSSLVLLLLCTTIIIITGIIYTEGLPIIINPYLRLKYHVFIVQSEGKILYIIMEKEKEFERPRFSEYIIDWYYDHLILVGFKDKKYTINLILPGQKKIQKNDDKPKTL